MTQLVRFAALLITGVVVYFIAGYWQSAPDAVRLGLKIALPLALLVTTHAGADLLVISSIF